MGARGTEKSLVALAPAVFLILAIVVYTSTNLGAKKAPIPSGRVAPKPSKKQDRSEPDSAVLTYDYVVNDAATTAVTRNKAVRALSRHPPPSSLLCLG